MKSLVYLSIGKICKIVSVFVHFLGTIPKTFGCPRGFHLTINDFFKTISDGSNKTELGLISTTIIPKPLNSESLNKFNNEYKYEESLIIINNLFNCRFVYEPHALISSDDRIIFSESAAYGMNPHEHWIFRKLKLPKILRLNGNSFMLGCIPNIWHLLMEEIPKLYRLQKAEIDINTFDYLIGRNLSLPQQREVYQIFNVNISKIVTFEEYKHIEFEKLTFFSPYYTPDIDGIKWMKKKLLSYYDIKTINKKRRLFISRENYDTKNIANFSVIRKLLKEYKFNIIQPENLTLKQQITAFSEANFIIGAHGAGLAANTIFCPDYGNVIEIRSENHMHDFAAPYVCMWASKINKMSHSILLSQTVKNKQLKGRSNTDSDFIVCPQELELLIQKHLNE